jgi:hypothetical protein
MKIIGVFLNILILIIILPTALIADTKNNKQDVPAGMQIIKIGGANVLVPEGTKVRKKGGLIILESASEYAAMKISNIEEQINQLEKEDKKLEKEIEVLKLLMEEANKAELINTPSQEKE